MNVSGSELKTFLYAAIMSSITVKPVKDDPINYCYSQLIPESLKIADEIIPALIAKTKFYEKNNGGADSFQGKLF